MKAKRTSIHASPVMQQLVADLRESHFNQASTVINAVIDRYMYTVEQSMPELTVGEWCALMDTLNGYVTTPISHACQGIHWSVADAFEHEKLGEKWKVDDGFPARVKALNTAQRIAILDARDRFWAAGFEHVANWREALEQCGCRIKEEDQ
jgi:hypothetical protein